MHRSEAMPRVEEVAVQPKEDNAKLEKQFSERIKVKLESGSIEIIDVKPEHPKTETPVLIAPGFTQGPDTMRRNILTLARGGRRVLMGYAPHGIKAYADSDISTSAYQTGKAMAHLETLDHQEVQKVDAVGHSEGALNLLIAAAMCPERFRNLVLINPAGLIGDDSFLETFKRFSENKVLVKKQAAENPEIKKTDDDSKRERAVNFLKNILKTYESSQSVSEAQVESLLMLVKQEGVGIAIIHTVDDQLFPMERVQKMTERARKATGKEVKSSDLIDGFYSIKGGHNQFYLEPEKYTKVIDIALDAMEKKKKV